MDVANNIEMLEAYATLMKEEADKILKICRSARESEACVSTPGQRRKNNLNTPALKALAAQAVAKRRAWQEKQSKKTLWGSSSGSSLGS